MRKIVFSIVAAGSLFLASCGTGSQGQRLGEGWIIHNEATTTMLELESAGVIDTDDLRSFQSIEKPVREGLNTATNAYLDDDPTNDSTVERTLQFIDPLLEQLILKAAEAE